MSDLQCPARLYVAWPVQGGAEPMDLVPSGESVAVVCHHEKGAPPDLKAIADLYRGEAVLVLVGGAPELVPDLLPGGLVALEIDGDGLRRGSK